MTKLIFLIGTTRKIDDWPILLCHSFGSNFFFLCFQKFSLTKKEENMPFVQVLFFFIKVPVSFFQQKEELDYFVQVSDVLNWHDLFIKLVFEWHRLQFSFLLSLQPLLTTRPSKFPAVLQLFKWKKYYEFIPQVTKIEVLKELPTLHLWKSVH